MPERIKALPVDDRGYPVPWFVAWVNDKPEFRAADGKKLRQAIRFGKCWVCGDAIISLSDQTFVIGPMCAVNRISSEPPSHRECADFSAKACPFLTKPQMVRREGNFPEGISSLDDPAGIAIKRNPGVSLLWRTRDFEVLREPNGFLFRIGDPLELVCYTEGRESTKAEIAHSVETGLPYLRSVAQAEGLHALSMLVGQVRQAKQLLGIA